MTAWKPAVVTILSALAELDGERFKTVVPQFYQQVIGLLLHQEVDSELRAVLFALFSRIGNVFKIIDE